MLMSQCEGDALTHRMCAEFEDGKVCDCWCHLDRILQMPGRMVPDKEAMDNNRRSM